jgi:predicted HicB family RNase H-like nuclease
VEIATDQGPKMPKKHYPKQRAFERDVRASATRTLRLDEDLRRRLEEAAKRSIRSVNSEIIFRLLSTFRQESAT